MWNKTHDKHPADDDVPEPEERLLPASAGQQARPPLPWRGSSDPAGGGHQASGEEEARSRLSQQERAQGQGPLFCGHERPGD